MHSLLTALGLAAVNAPSRTRTVLVHSGISAAAIVGIVIAALLVLVILALAARPRGPGGGFYRRRETVVHDEPVAPRANVGAGRRTEVVEDGYG